MSRPKLPAGPGRPRSANPKVPVSLKLDPAVKELAERLAAAAFGGNFTAAVEHCVRVGCAGLPPESARPR